ncbi:hypothetical protein KIPB_010881, partial [Kipferlia bialata]
AESDRLHDQIAAAKGRAQHARSELATLQSKDGERGGQTEAELKNALADARKRERECISETREVQRQIQSLGHAGNASELISHAIFLSLSLSPSTPLFSGNASELISHAITRQTLARQRLNRVREDTDRERGELGAAVRHSARLLEERLLARRDTLLKEHQAAERMRQRENTRYDMERQALEEMENAAALRMQGEMTSLQR